MNEYVHENNLECLCVWGRNWSKRWPRLDAAGLFSDLPYTSSLALCSLKTGNICLHVVAHLITPHTWLLLVDEDEMWSSASCDLRILPESERVKRKGTWLCAVVDWIMLYNYILIMCVCVLLWWLRHFDVTVFCCWHFDISVFSIRVFRCGCCMIFPSFFFFFGVYSGRSGCILWCFFLIFRVVFNKKILCPCCDCVL